MNIFTKEIETTIQENKLELVSSCLASIILDHKTIDDRTEIFNTEHNTLYLCGSLKIVNNETKKDFIGYSIKEYFENKGFKNKDLIFILSNESIIEKHGFTILDSPFFEIMDNTNDDIFSQPFENIPTKNLDLFVDEEI